MEAIFGGLIPLLFLAAIVAAVVYGIRAVTRHRRGFPETDPGIGTVRRLYFYVVSFVALMMAASGIAEIIHFVLDSIVTSDVVIASRIRLAVGLSLTIVGIPLWALHWRMIGRHVKELPVETRSVLRKVYNYVVLAVAAGIWIGTALTLLQWLSGNRTFSGYSMAGIVVWGAVWAYHWRLETDEGQPTPETRAVRRLYLYVMAAGMLVVAALGIGLLINIVLREAYDSLISVPLLSGAGLWGSTTKVALSLALVGGPVWAVHWLHFAGRDYESTLRQLYIYLLAVFGGVITVLSALGVMIYGVLVWTIGVPADESAASHFRFLPGALASLIVGGTVLAYHLSATARREELATTEAQGTRRSYPYLLALVGLVTLTIGIVVLVNTALGVLLGSGGTAIAGRDLWRNGIALSITLSVLVGPVWGYYWRQVQLRFMAGDLQERTSTTRRQFTFAVLGAGMLALLGSVSFLLFVFLRELLDGDLSQVLRGAKGSISIIVPVAIFLPYYWMVYRADRRVAAEMDLPEEPSRRKEVTVLVSEGGAAFLQGLEAALGHDVTLLRWADPDASHPEFSEAGFQELAQRISDASGLNVLLIPDDAGVRVLSYQ